MTATFSMHIDDSLFHRKIVESSSTTDERNRGSENKKGRWDKPDVQINNSEDSWERLVERASRNQRRFVLKYISVRFCYLSSYYSL